VGQGVGGLGREPPSAEKGMIDNLVHASEGVLDEGEFRGLRQIVETLVDTVAEDGSGS
jgi:hypothetical protein